MDFTQAVISQVYIYPSQVDVHFLLSVIRNLSFREGYRLIVFRQKIQAAGHWRWRKESQAEIKNAIRKDGEN